MVVCKAGAVLMCIIGQSIIPVLVLHPLLWSGSCCGQNLVDAEMRNRTELQLACSAILSVGTGWQPELLQH